MNFICFLKFRFQNDAQNMQRKKKQCFSELLFSLKKKQKLNNGNNNREREKNSKT